MLDSLMCSLGAWAQTIAAIVASLIGGVVTAFVAHRGFAASVKQARASAETTIRLGHADRLRLTIAGMFASYIRDDQLFNPNPNHELPGTLEAREALRTRAELMRHEALLFLDKDAPACKELSELLRDTRIVGLRMKELRDYRDRVFEVTARAIREIEKG